MEWRVSRGEGRRRELNKLNGLNCRIITAELLGMNWGAEAEEDEAAEARDSRLASIAELR